MRECDDKRYFKADAVFAAVSTVPLSALPQDASAETASRQPNKNAIDERTVFFMIVYPPQSLIRRISMVTGPSSPDGSNARYWENPSRIAQP